MADGDNLVGRAAGIAADVLRMAQTRLELLGVELQQERDSIVLQLKLTMLGIVAAGVAGIGAVLWAALSLAPGPRGVALGALTLTFVALSLVATLAARSARRGSRRLFAAVVAQLTRDRETLVSTDPASGP